MRSRKIAVLCVAASIAMMVFGAYRGEMETVLKKAVVLCLECIGIG
ncbi:MAG: CD1871A family CXXC motif-containing protein [Clostridia bacterium]|nr:CD1871A family CXXC motif-containing protein [Clostridia bacterium]MDO4356218.1 CD1871A family CXXC motif-containing protein [Clostridia bacterium]